jgi:chromosome segregation ATPase
MEQHMALSPIPCDPDSAAKAFADLKAELEKEKATREIAQIEVDMLTKAVKGLKISTNKFAAQIPILEEKVKYLENKVVDRQNEVRAWELCLECTTKANDNYKGQNAQLTRMLESEFPWSFKALNHP